MQLFVDSCAVANVLAEWSGTWKEYDWKTGNKEIGRRDLWIYFSEWAKHFKIFVCHVSAHQRGTSEEEHFNNQVDWMTHSVNQSTSFTSRLSLSNGS